jgi:hypothetical protein
MSAERTRRYRERKRLCEEEGNHSLCGPGTKCPQVGKAPAGAVTAPGDVTGDVTLPSKDPVTPAPLPAGLGERGSRLWEEWSAAGFGPGHLMMLEEACRTADTLERLHGLLAADQADWLELVLNEAESDDEATEFRVVVNGLLVEIRQQQANFRQQVAELRLSGRGTPVGRPAESGETTPAAESTPTVPTAVSGGGGLGDLINAAGRFRTATEG